MSEATVIIIDGEGNFHLGLEQLLIRDDIAVNRVENLPKAIKSFEVYRPQMVILNCHAKGIGSLTTCQAIRTVYSGLLLLISQQKDNDFHKLALDLGADSSMAYGDGAPLVASNIKALLRRFVSLKPPGQLSFGRLTVDAQRRDVFIGRQAVALSTIEFQLFWSLAQKAGCVVSREEIHKDLYNTTYNGYDRSIDLYISRIRQKIAHYPEYAGCLKTVRGVGYQLIDDTDSRKLPIQTDTNCYNHEISEL